MRRISSLQCQDCFKIAGANLTNTNLERNRALTILPKIVTFCDPGTDSVLLDNLLKGLNHAGVAKLVDARDLKSLGPKGPCRFNSGPRHRRGGKRDV